MCSVVGYIGSKRGGSFIIEGLSRLEYRGYDSAGLACIDETDNRLIYAKAEGRLCNLKNMLVNEPVDGHVGIGHTRWSTHGVSSFKNAHPHFDAKKKIAVVHNGIIENHRELRTQLEQAGHVFYSDTDTEIIAHLFDALLVADNELLPALVNLVRQLDGAYAFAAILQNYADYMVLVRRRSPLCIGIGIDEMFIASDTLAFAGKTDRVVFIPDESFVLLKKDSMQVYTFAGDRINVNVEKIALAWEFEDTLGYEHHMLKEIYEQKIAIHDTIGSLSAFPDQIWDMLGVTKAYIKNLNNLSIIGCGTSWHAARIAQFFFEQICSLPTSVHLASEFRYKLFFPDYNSLYIAISQSGETADTLEAMRLISGLDLHTLALTNMASSTIVRQAKGYLLTKAGREVAVASTKAFSTQLTALYWFAHLVAKEKELISTDQFNRVKEDLLLVAEILENSIERYRLEIDRVLAKKYSCYKKAIFLGRHMSYPFAMEAALKLKEIAYIFSQCYPAGELKHGPLALVDEDTPIFVFSYDDITIYQKLLSNVQEAKARGGHIVAFAFQGQDELCQLADTVFVLPRVKPLLGPLSMVGLVQYFVYAIARELERPIDKPRNLAKSVTVE